MNDSNDGEKETDTFKCDQLEQPKHVLCDNIYLKSLLPFLINLTSLETQTCTVREFQTQVLVRGGTELTCTPQSFTLLQSHIH